MWLGTPGHRGHCFTGSQATRRRVLGVRQRLAACASFSSRSLKKCRFSRWRCAASGRIRISLPWSRRSLPCPRRRGCTAIRRRGSPSCWSLATSPSTRFYPAVAGVLWARRRRPDFSGAFRRLTDALSVGYLFCYATYLLFPTRSPSHNVGLPTQPRTRDRRGHSICWCDADPGDAGVHGNAFPSAHIMLAFVVLVFAFRYFPARRTVAAGLHFADVPGRGLRRLPLRG